MLTCKWASARRALARLFLNAPGKGLAHSKGPRPRKGRVQSRMSKKAQTAIVAVSGIDLPTARKAANGFVSAAITEQGASARFLGTVASIASKLAEGRNSGLTSADYAKAIGPLVKAGFDKAVKAGRLSETTVPGYCSRIKMAVLAVVNGVGTPNKGEAIKPFLDRVAQPLAAAKTPSGESVLPVNKVGARKGAPKATKGSKSAKGGKLVPASGTEPQTNAAPMLAAALIVTGRNKARAEKLVAIFSKGGFVAEFDKWAATILA